MALQYSVTELPPVWPGKRTAHPKAAPFKSQWTRTQKALERELRHLGAKNVELALDLPRGGMDLRRDGMLTSDARPRPAVILSFLDSEGARHAYPCDRFGWWQDNLHAIAVVLEDLRRAERYGVQSALIRAGFKALPAAAEAPGPMSAREAADIVAGFVEFPRQLIETEASVAAAAVRTARAKAHPDAGGTSEGFQEVQEAAAALSEHHGRAL